MSWISWPIATIRAAEMAAKSKATGSNRGYLQFCTQLHLVLQMCAEHTKEQLLSDTQNLEKEMKYIG
ncbi:MAG: hypothetical protein WBL67_19760 [Nitrososphaeraceae archaeon]